MEIMGKGVERADVLFILCHHPVLVEDGGYCRKWKRHHCNGEVEESALNRVFVLYTLRLKPQTYAANESANAIIIVMVCVYV